MNRPWLQHYDNGVPESIDFQDISLNQIFEDAVNNSPNVDAIYYFGTRITYSELEKYVKQFSKALIRLGLKKGDRVALMLPNIPQYVIFHFAILRVGGILVPTNPLYVERELAYQINNSGAEIIITLDIYYPKVAAIKESTSLRCIIINKISEFLPFHLKVFYPIKAKKSGYYTKVPRLPGVHFFNDLLTEPFPFDLPDLEVKPGDIAILLYTGGTTGLSKGAVLTHQNLIANVMQTCAWYCFVEEKKEAILSALPFFHSYGLTTCLHMAVYIKSKMILIPNPRDLKAVLNAIQKEKATLFPGVPTLYIAINNFPKIEKYDLSSIKGCISGGAALPLEVARKFEDISKGKLIEGYGLSETSPVTHANALKGLRKEGAIGMPVPNTDARIVDPETKEVLAVGELGELAVKGPQVMQGYWKMESETEQVLKDGWLFTGDMAKMDEDGFFYILDRKKDMIIAGGFNIYPREIEEVLFEHPDIEEAAVVGIPDEYRGETVMAFIVCKKGKSITVDEILAFCKSNLASFKRPKSVEFRESLPKSNIGKVLRRVLKEEMLNSGGD